MPDHVLVCRNDEGSFRQEQEQSHCLKGGNCIGGQASVEVVDENDKSSVYSKQKTGKFGPESSDFFRGILFLLLPKQATKPLFPILDRPADVTHILNIPLTANDVSKRT